MTTASSTPNLEELSSALERSLYSILTVTLWRDPLESVNVIAMWIWLGTTVFKNVIELVLSQRDVHLIDKIADEAATYIGHMFNSNTTDASDENIELPLTQHLLAYEVAPDFFSKNRGSAIVGIKYILNKVLFTLRDLMQQAEYMANTRVSVENEISMLAIIEDGVSMLNNYDSLRITPEFNHMQRVVDPDDRSLLATFSKGYLISKREIYELFNQFFGDNNCIESINMENVKSDQQPLNARIVLYNPDVIEDVLCGAKIAKFKFYGKDVWMRKFVAKGKQDVPPCFNSPRSGPFGTGANR